MDGWGWAPINMGRIDADDPESFLKNRAVARGYRVLQTTALAT
jgi:hypothetical protein